LNISLITAFCIVGLFQILYTFITISKIESRYFFNKKLIVFFISLFALSLIDTILEIEFIYNRFPHLYLIYWPFNFLYGPFLYLYIKSITYPKSKIEKSSYRHFIPFFLSIIFYLPFYFGFSAPEKVIFIEGYLRDDFYTFFISEILTFFEVLQIALYLFLVFKRLKLHQKYLNNNFSSQEILNLKWFYRLFISSFLLWLFYSVDQFIIHTGILMEVAIISWVIAFNYSILSHSIQITKLSFKNIEIAEPSNRIKIEKDRVDLKKEAKEIESFIEKSRAYLDENLNLESLAKSSGYTRNQISLILNQELNISFYDYINRKRIEYAKKLLLDGNYDGNILKVSLESGFKSRSVFYSNFKKYCKMTPTEYKKLQKSA